MRLTVLIFILISLRCFAQVTYDTENLCPYTTLNGDTIHILKVSVNNIGNTTRILTLMNVREKTGYGPTAADFNPIQFITEYDISSAYLPSWRPYIFASWFKALMPHSTFVFFFLSRKHTSGSEFIDGHPGVIYCSKSNGNEEVLEYMGWKEDYIIIPLKNR